MAHSYTDMALQAVNLLHGSAEADFDSIAATVRAQNTALRYQRRLLVNAMARLVAAGKVDEQQRLTPPSSKIQSIYVPLAPAPPARHGTSQAHALSRVGGSKATIKKAGGVAVKGGSASALGIRALRHCFWGPRK